MSELVKYNTNIYEDDKLINLIKDDYSMQLLSNKHVYWIAHAFL